MVVEMHAFNRTSEDEKKVFISYNLFYYRLAVLLYPRTSQPVLSRYLFREESRLTEHPGCTIYHQPLPDSTGGSDYWLWHLHERNGSLPRSHHRVLSCLLHIRNTVCIDRLSWIFNAGTGASGRICWLYGKRSQGFMPDKLYGFWWIKNSISDALVTQLPSSSLWCIYKSFKW